jgi:hypothetical protein
VEVAWVVAAVVDLVVVVVVVAWEAVEGEWTNLDIYI